MRVRARRHSRAARGARARGVIRRRRRRRSRPRARDQPHSAPRPRARRSRGTTPPPRRRLSPGGRCARARLRRDRRVRARVDGTRGTRGSCRRRTSLDAPPVTEVRAPLVAKRRGRTRLGATSGSRGAAREPLLGRRGSWSGSRPAAPRRANGDPTRGAPDPGRDAGVRVGWREDHARERPEGPGRRARGGPARRFTVPPRTRARIPRSAPRSRRWRSTTRIEQIVRARAHPRPPYGGAKTPTEEEGRVATRRTRRRPLVETPPQTPWPVRAVDPERRTRRAPPRRPVDGGSFSYLDARRRNDDIHVVSHGAHDRNFRRPARQVPFVRRDGGEPLPPACEVGDLVRNRVAEDVPPRARWRARRRAGSRRRRADPTAASACRRGDASGDGVEPTAPPARRTPQDAVKRPGDGRGARSETRRRTRLGVPPRRVPDPARPRRWRAAHLATRARRVGDGPPRRGDAVETVTRVA